VIGAKIMKKNSQPSSRLMNAMTETNAMIKQKNKGKSVHVALAEMKLSCIE
jgi:hypothetical protein